MVNEYIEISFCDHYREYTNVIYRPNRIYDIKEGDELQLFTMLKEMIPKMRITIGNNDQLLIISEEEFQITHIGPSLQKVMGFTEFGQNSVNIIRPSALGSFNLTPVLYLVSNIGAVCHTYKNREYKNRKILMRIHNNFIQDFPITSYNHEFSSVIPSNTLSDVTFQSVDANFNQIRLLAPMYLIAAAIPIPDRVVKYITVEEVT